MSMTRTVWPELGKSRTAAKRVAYTSQIYIYIYTYIERERDNIL